MKHFHSGVAALFFGLMVATSMAGPAEWVGKQLPTLTIEFLGAKPPAGKAMLVEFWATWCGPCRANIPHINELHETFKDLGLVIVGVSGEDKDVVERFLESNQMNYPLALDRENELAQKLGVTAIPQAFLVDRTGKIVWQGQPVRLPRAEIEQLLQ